MRGITLILMSLMVAFYSTAQNDIRGIVLDGDSMEPLAGASVVLRDSNGKIKKFASSDPKGEFSLQLPESDSGYIGYTLDVSILSYAKQTLSLDRLSRPVRVIMVPESAKLKEVAVKAQRIREQGDTITYNVGTFAQNQDRSIGDVLNRMPGIDVKENGRIQYQGEDINKFYIEGSDLLGGKYGVATKGISHEDVGAVEVMENHQPMQVLSGVSFSDKAAINLKLKEKAKASWSAHGDAGVGYCSQPEGITWDGELFAMAVKPSFQNIFSVKTNNIGQTLSTETTDFLTSRRESGLKPYVSVTLMEQPPLKLNRFLFNRSAILSSNSLWKISSGELKAQVDYSYNYVTAQAANVTTYFLNDGNRVITENRDGNDRMHSISGKLIYEKNQKTTFINNSLQTNIDWDDMSLTNTGSINNEQKVSLPNYYVANKFKMIKRFKDKHLVTFISNNEWESMPQTLKVNPKANSANSLSQSISDYAFYTHESAAYSFILKGFNIGLEGGFKAYFRSFDSKLNEMPEAIPGATTNLLNTKYLTLYATPKIEYWVRKVNLILSAPLSVANYTFDKKIANRSEFYFSPSVSFNWKPSNRLSLTARGGIGRSPMNPNMIYPGYVMSNYRTFQSGVEDFYSNSSKSVSGSFSYKHSRKGFFANGMVMQSWSSTPYTLSQQLFGDYIVYSYMPAKSKGKIFMTDGSIGKTLDSMHGSANIGASYNRSESTIFSQSHDIKSIDKGWSLSGKVNGSLLKWLGFDYSLQYSSYQLVISGTQSPWLSSLESILLLNILPYRKLQWQLIGEFYRNELTQNNYKNFILFDTRLIYNLSKRLELSANLNNILNKRTYCYTQYGQLSSFESTKWLRGREFLISLRIRK